MNMRASVIAAGVAFAVLTASGCAVTRGQQTAGAYVDDTVITSTIKTRHAESKEVAMTSISVETLNGVVLLSGFAKTPQEKMMAETIARQVGGVKSVRNEIVVRP